jgi:hypothetical protein
LSYPVSIRYDVYLRGLKADKMASKYNYYIISGFIPVYQQRLDMIIRPGLFRTTDEASHYYSKLKAKLPTTSKIMDFDKNTALYFLKYDVDRLIMTIRAVKFTDAVKAFDALRCLLALAYHWYKEEADIIPIEHKPSFSRLSMQDLITLAGTLDPIFFSVEIRSGIQVSERQILDIKEQLVKTYLNSNIRRALACFYQSQNIYYTHLVSSYVAVHSRPELIYSSQEEYRQNNFRYQERLHASLLTCYRGIEALYSKNFRTHDFTKVNRRRLESYMDAKLPNAPSRSRYWLRFYRQREAHPPKYRLIVSMLEVLFRARNRAAHGHRWTRRHRLETFGSDLVDESKFFLAHLINSALI